MEYIFQKGKVFRLIEEGELAAAGLFQPAPAKVIAAAFGQGADEIDSQTFVNKGDIFLYQLFLQGDGVGADDDFLFVFHDPLEGGDEVGKAFSHACAGFDHEVVGFFESERNSLRHLDLLRSGFIASEGLSNGSLVAEEDGGIDFIWIGSQ